MHLQMPRKLSCSSSWLDCKAIPPAITLHQLGVNMVKRCSSTNLVKLLLRHSIVDFVVTIGFTNSGMTSSWEPEPNSQAQTALRKLHSLSSRCHCNPLSASAVKFDCCFCAVKSRTQRSVLTYQPMLHSKGLPSLQGGSQRTCGCGRHLLQRPSSRPARQRAFDVVR